MIAYYLNENIRILVDSLNFIAEIKKIITNDTIQKNNETKYKWVRIGYYISLDGAIRGILRAFPNIEIENKGKSKEVLKKYLEVYNELFSKLEVHILSEINKKRNEIDNN